MVSTVTAYPVIPKKNTLLSMIESKCPVLRPRREFITYVERNERVIKVYAITYSAGYVVIER
jgi:hypothetical protein